MKVFPFFFSQRQTKATVDCFVLARVSMQKQQGTSGERRSLAKRHYMSKVHFTVQARMNYH
jgi:hypothetical protein